jgi:pyruvate dehydrogenase E2 component (dihydrolipoamide acetyltransferase)
VAYEFKLPDLGEGLTEGEISRWLVEEGQDIAEDQPLVEIATDKTTVEIPSPASGAVSQILVAEGEVVPVGTVLVVIGGGDASGPVQVSDTEPRPKETPVRAREAKVRATPLVRKVAQELGVDLETVPGTGAQGRITEDDVRAAAASSGHVQVSDTETGPEATRVQLRGIRRQMFEHLTRAHREIPAVTWVEECDFSDVDLKRLVPLVLQAVTQSLREFPELNSRVEEGDLVLLDQHDIGIAVQTEQGLVVPVVHGAHRLSLDELDAEVRRLAEAANAGTLKPEELRGGTFTVTSAG